MDHQLPKGPLFERCGKERRTQNERAVQAVCEDVQERLRGNGCARSTDR